MKDHESRRTVSVYAVLAILTIVVAATIWLGLRRFELPALQPVSDHREGQQGAAEDLLPEIAHFTRCDDDRPCS